MSLQERRLRAMGTDVHLLAGGPGPDQVSAALDRASARLTDLDRRWTRFRANSELRQLNQSAGRPVLVPPDTFALVLAAQAAWQATGGRFDPTVLHAMEANGYDRDFALVQDHDDVDDAGAARTPVEPTASPGLAGVDLDPVLSSVTLPRGVALDLGGIGKGHTADLVLDDLVAAGCTDVCVNLGGDLRVHGPGPDSAGWWVSLDDPVGTLVGLSQGAMATSTTMRRQWQQSGETRHHLIDPTTGRPADGGVRSVTVVADTAARAEVWAKAALVAGWDQAPDVLNQQGLSGLLVGDDLQVALTGAMADHLFQPPLRTDRAIEQFAPTGVEPEPGDAT